MRSERHHRLVALLRRHERITAQCLADELGVSRRTVLRDLEALSVSGVPIYAEYGPGGGYSLVAGYRPPVAAMTPADVETLLLPGGAHAAQALGRLKEFHTAKAKLESTLTHDAALGAGAVSSWMLVAPEGWGEAVDPPELLPSIAQAAAARDELVVRYAALGRPADERVVQPVGVVLGGRHWYLVARRLPEGAMRTYRVERIEHVEATGRRARVEIDLADAWREATRRYREAPHVEFTLDVSAAFAGIARHLLSSVCHVIDEGVVSDAAADARPARNDAAVAGVVAASDAVGDGASAGRHDAECSADRRAAAGGGAAGGEADQGEGGGATDEDVVRLRGRGRRWDAVASVVAGFGARLRAVEPEELRREIAGVAEQTCSAMNRLAAAREADVGVRDGAARSLP